MREATRAESASAIRYQRQMINLAENTIDDGVNEDGSLLTEMQIKSWENRIKFAEAVIKAHQQH
jgi:hypothetical protein